MNMNRASQWKERMKTWGRCFVNTVINKTKQFQFKQICKFRIFKLKKIDVGEKVIFR